MRDLNGIEVGYVGGGDLLKTASEYLNDAGKAVGKVWAWGTKMQQHIDAQENILLGGMSQGA